MEQLSKMMRGAAISAIIAMLPLAVYILLSLTDITDGRSAEAISIVQGIAAFIWAGFLLACIPSARQINMSYIGFILCAVGIVIGGILLFKLEDLVEDFVKDYVVYGIEPDFTTLTLKTIIVNGPIVAGVLMLGKYLPALKKASIVYGILAFFPLVTEIGFKLLETKDSHDYGYMKVSHVDPTIITSVFILLDLIILTCAAIALVAWWKALIQAQWLEDENHEEEDDQPQDVEASLSAEQMSKLDAMTDEQLNDLISTPTLYSSSMIEGARKALVLRKSLSSIKNMSDEKLLEAVHGNPMGYSYEALDEISMELYRRQTPAFVNEVYHMSTQELQVIVQNPNAYFKGYVEQAKRVLKDRL